MRKLFWQAVFWAKGIIIGLRAVRKIQLGSRVFYDGQWWFVSNWAGEPRMNLSKGSRWGSKPEYRERVPREEIRPSRSPLEFIHRFRMMRRWYMTSWFAIDVNRRLFFS
jgi:hypothetical protein